MLEVAFFSRELSKRPGDFLALLRAGIYRQGDLVLTQRGSERERCGKHATTAGAVSERLPGEFRRRGKGSGKLSLILCLRSKRFYWQFYVFGFRRGSKR